MRLAKVLSAIALGAMIAHTPLHALGQGQQEPTAQAGDQVPTAAPSPPSPDNLNIVTGHPFSAMSSVRHVRVLPDGKLQFLRYDRYPTQLARDNQGRVRMQIVDVPQPECDNLTVRVPPVCPVWDVFVFDPTARTMTDWVGGELSGHVVCTKPLSSGQLASAYAATVNLPDPPKVDPEEPGQTAQDLGERLLGGIHVTGVRITTTHPPGYGSHDPPSIRIHEVWMSPAMKLVVRIIDGDPHGEETIAGLEHISLTPDASLFSAPGNFQVQRCIPVPQSAQVHVDQIEDWFVK